MSSDNPRGLEARRDDLAAMVLPDSLMPSGFELEWGAYVESDRVIQVDGSPLGDDSQRMVSAYEATYSYAQGIERIDLQVIRFRSPSDVRLDFALANDSIERLTAAGSQKATFDPLGITGSAVSSFSGYSLGVSTDPGDAYPVYSVAYQVEEFLVRSVVPILGEPANVRLDFDNASYTAYAAATRAISILDGVPLDDVDFSLPLISPRFNRIATHDFYLHSDLYGRPPRNARDREGFVSGYCRGITIEDQSQGRYTRGISVSTYKYESEALPVEVVRNPKSWIADQLLERSRVSDSASQDLCLVMCFPQGSQQWRSLARAPSGKYLFETDVHGFDSKQQAIAEARRLAVELANAAHTDALPLSINVAELTA